MPFWKMRNADELVGNVAHDNSAYRLAATGEVYVVYLPTGGTGELDLGASERTFSVHWFDPRRGGALQAGAIADVRGPGRVTLGAPPAAIDQDWVVLVRE